MISLIDSVWYSGILSVIFEEHVGIYLFADFCSAPVLHLDEHIERRVRAAHGRVSRHAKNPLFLVFLCIFFMVVPFKVLIRER